MHRALEMEQCLLGGFIVEIYSAMDINMTKGAYLIYAPPGMGKTTSLKYLPGRTLVLDVDRTTRVLKGCNNIDICEIDNIDTFTAWANVLKELVAKYGDKYDNIAVDNISELERCILAALGRKGKNNGVPSMADYQYMQLKLADSLRYLKQTNANVIFTAWETVDLFTNDSGQQYNRTFPQVNAKVLNNVCGLCDVVAKLAVNSDGERGFILSATNTYYAKNQIDDRKGCLQDELILGDGNGSAELSA